MKKNETSFSTNLHDEAILKENAKIEELRQNLLKNIFRTIGKLRAEMPFKESYIFGSVTKPFKFSRYSDADIAFLGLKDKDFFKAISFISREIGRDVDIVQLEGFRFADKIKKEGIKWTLKNMPF